MRYIRLTTGFSMPSESARAADELLNSFEQFSSEVQARLDRIEASSDVNARLDRLERIAQQTLALVRETALTSCSGGKVPTGVPLDKARCYSYICAAGKMCYAPRCPRSRGQPEQPSGPASL